MSEIALQQEIINALFDKLASIESLLSSMDARVETLEKRDEDTKIRLEDTKVKLDDLAYKLELVSDGISQIDERQTRRETERRFARTINKTGYRPEIKRMEPSGDLLIEYRDTFSYPPSAYRR